MPYQPAVLGTGRLNNFRLNYLTADQAADRPTHIRIILGGVDISGPTSPIRVLNKSMSIRDILFDAPNTCTITFYGVAPTVGQRLEVWINSDAPVVLFAGELQTVRRTYKGRPTTVVHPCTAIDDAAAASRKRPLDPFLGISATHVAQYLIQAYSPGFSTAGIEDNLPAVTVNFDGSEGGLKGCLTQIAKRIGGYWYIENKTLYLFRTPPAGAPDPIIDAPGRFLHEPAITWAIDKSQVRTRVYGKGASTQVTTTIAAATDLVPVQEATMFNPAGGRAIVAQTPDGAASRRVTYTGVQLGGGGGLVGAGATPSTAPGLVLQDGAGVESGVHQYAYTFKTAGGESLPSPISAITVGPVTPPTVAPTPGIATAGGAVDAGTHTYAVTFVTATGETTPTPDSTVVTTTAGTSVPTPGATAGALRKVVGNLVSSAAYRYQTTFTTSTGGETLPGAASAAISPTVPTGPTFVASTVDFESGGALIPGMHYDYALSGIVGGYETALSPVLGVNIPNDALLTRIVLGYVATSADARITGRKLYRWVTSAWRLVTTINDNLPNLFYRDGAADASLGAARAGTGAIGTPPGDQVAVTVPTSGDPRAVGRKVYRSDNGAAYRFLGSLANNTATQLIDNTASVAGNPTAPVTDTSGSTSYRTVPITAIATGPANVTARKLYRSSNGAAAKLVTTIANNTATTYTDTAASASLGATVPATNTALANRVLLSVPVGPAAVTGRTVFRTPAGGAVLKNAILLDNTTTTAVDSLPDASLGPFGVPTSDTSGLTQPAGQVPAGATSILVANTVPFATGGGWAVVGNGEQVIRYSGKTANSLTGVPASGPGAVTAAVSYNSTITAAPALTGVAGLLEQILRGSPIHVWVQRDDVAAQAAMVALDGGGDGIYEYIASDERRSEASLLQVCDAELALYSRPLVTVTYASRDLKTKSGKKVDIALASPAIAESLTIQDVTITEIGIAKRLAPKFTVTASSVHHTFEAILRTLIREAGS